MADNVKILSADDFESSPLAEPVRSLMAEDFFEAPTATAEEKRTAAKEQLKQKASDTASMVKEGFIDRAKEAFHAINTLPEAFIGKSEETKRMEAEKALKASTYGTPYNLGSAGFDVVPAALMPMSTYPRAVLGQAAYNMATTPGDASQRALAGGAGALAGAFGKAGVDVIGKRVNAVRGTYAPGYGPLIAEDIAQQKATGVGKPLSQYFPPSKEMEEFDKVMQSNVAPNKIIEVLKNKQAQIEAEGKARFNNLNNVVSANQADINVNPANLQTAAQEFFKHFGGKIKNITDAESAATLQVLAGDLTGATKTIRHIGRAEADKTLGLSAPAADRAAYAERWAQQAIADRQHQLQNMTFDDMWKLHKDVGRAVGSLSENASPQMEYALKRMYGSIYKDLENVSSKSGVNDEVNTAMKDAVAYYRDNVIPWTTGVSKEGAPIPILHNLARGRYEVAPRQAVADVVGARGADGMDAIATRAMTPEESYAFSFAKRQPKQAKAYVAADPTLGTSPLEHPILSGIHKGAELLGVSPPMWLKRMVAAQRPTYGGLAAMGQRPVVGGLSAYSRDIPESSIYGDRYGRSQ